MGHEAPMPCRDPTPADETELPFPRRPGAMPEGCGYLRNRSVSGILKSLVKGTSFLKT